VGTGGNFVDKRYASTANTNVAPGYATQQAMIGYKLNKNVEFQMNVYNLWNTDYIQAVGSNFLPGAGRSFVFSANVKF
jgi:catecholate siderophore receptor